jgi:hypothetical protein
MSNISSSEKFFNCIFIGLLTLLVLILTVTVSEASPVQSFYRRQNAVSDADIREFKLWVKYAR